ncbi:MAG: PAS domain-containing protein [Pedobacter sp.]
MDEEIELINRLLGEQAWLLTTVLSANKSGIVITDHIAEDQPIIYCNDAFLIMTGYSREEVIGKNCRFLQGTQLKLHSRTRIKIALANGGYCNERIINHKKDGSSFINDLYLAPIRDADGTVTHYIGVQNQITGERNESIYGSGISHELRTPLTALKGCLQLLSRDLIPDDLFAQQKILLEMSQDNLNRLSKAIENVIQTNR